MASLYIKVYESECDEVFKVTLETLIVIFVYKICDSNEIKLKLLLQQDDSNKVLFNINLKDVDYIIIDKQMVMKIAFYCIWPVVVVDTTVVAGLCAVARQIIKSTSNEETSKLLGFREACLMACNESSIWTKFCEIDIISTVKNIIKNYDFYIKTDIVNIPGDLTRFEYHLEQPVKIHNIYKIARNKHNNKDIKSSVPQNELNLEHMYSEGPFMTLADIILYPCYQILVNIFGFKLFEKYLPLSLAWLENIKIQLPNLDIIQEHIVNNLLMEEIQVVQDEIQKQSLYAADPARYKPEKRIFTKQIDIEHSLNLINDSFIEIVNEFEPFGYTAEFNWSSVPLEVNPVGGSLPVKRANRKCEQLENLAKAVITIVGNTKCIITDFCSGSGHLGLLLSVLLPNCNIILVENKQRSLDRAKERIVKLNLTNITLLQCNMDYFKAKFDIGIALHACGVATDLVLQSCYQNKANFVCSPCCYGSIHDCYHLKYPRSEKFRNSLLTHKDYLSLAHAADQTHDNHNVKTKQGFFCMDVIDTDRKLLAIEYGYEVHLGKLLPTTCSPKNNLLVGIFKK